MNDSIVACGRQPQQVRPLGFDRHPCWQLGWPAAKTSCRMQLVPSIGQGGRGPFSFHILLLERICLDMAASCCRPASRPVGPNPLLKCSQALRFLSPPPPPAHASHSWHGHGFYRHKWQSSYNLLLRFAGQRPILLSHSRQQLDRDALFPKSSSLPPDPTQTFYACQANPDC